MAEQIFYPYNRGESLRKVDNFSSGFSNDGIFGHIINIPELDENGVPTGNMIATKFERVTKGPMSSDEAGIFSNGSDMTSRLQAVIDHPWVNILNVHAEKGGAILISGTVTIPSGKVIRVAPGTSFTGTGTLNVGTLSAGMTQQIFGDTLNVTIQKVEGETLSIAWFGADPTLVDNSVQVNKAIQVVLNSTTLPKRLYVPKASYAFTNPILIYKWNGTNYDQATIEIFSEDSGSVVTVAKFAFNYKDRFGIGWILGKGIIIRGISIDGLFNPSIGVKSLTETTFDDFGDDQLCREDRYAPYTGIASDFAGYQLPPSGGGYPGLSAYYRGTPNTSGSTGCRIINCAITKFIVCVGYSLNGVTQNGDSMQIRNCTLDTAKVAIAYGQDQTKNCSVEEIICWRHVHTFVDTMRFGTGNGAPPTIRKASFAGTINQMFNIDSTGRFGFFAREIFSESTYRIGKIVGAPSTFSDCIFNSIQNQGATGTADAMGNPDLFLEAQNVTFDNVTMKIYDNLFNKRLNFQSTSSIYRNCWFDLPPFVEAKSNKFEMCPIGQTYRIGPPNSTGATFADFAGNVVWGRYKNEAIINGIRYSYEYNTNDYDWKGAVGTYLFTVNEAARTATTIMTSSFIGYHFKLGDYFYILNKASFDDASDIIPIQVIGRLYSYDSGTQTATLVEVPPNIHTGTYLIQSSSIIYTGVPFSGRTVNGTNVIHDVEGFFPVAGQMLSSVGGRAFVDLVDTGAKTVTISWSTAGFTASDVVFANGDPELKIYHSSPPHVVAITAPSTYVLNGTTWIVKELNGSTGIQDLNNYVFTRSGYLNASAVPGAINQAAWFLRPTKYEAPDTFIVTSAEGSESRVVEQGVSLNQIQLLASNPMTVFIGTTEAGNEISGSDGVPLETNKTQFLFPQLPADTPFSIFVSGVSGGGQLTVKLLKKPL